MPGGWSDDDAFESGKTRIEVRGSLELAKHVERLGREALRSRQLIVTPSLIRDLQRIAMRDVLERPGEFRMVDGNRPIVGSRHQPPSHREVPEMIDAMCAYINGTPPIFPTGDDQMRQSLSSGLDIAAYALWRTNWIHPFEDGNGRTSRALAYLIFTAHARMILPGNRALPERICAERIKFYRCLEAADAAYMKKRRIRVQQLREFIKKHILGQLHDALEEERNSKPPIGGA